MSKEYLRDISDVEGNFRTSTAICLQLSSQITRLANKTRNLSSDEIRKLQEMQERLKSTFQRMENQLKQMTRRAQAGEDTVTFPKLYDQVQAIRLIITQTHVPHRTGKTKDTLHPQLQQIGSRTMSSTPPGTSTPSQ